VLSARFPSPLKISGRGVSEKFRQSSTVLAGSAVGAGVVRREIAIELSSLGMLSACFAGACCSGRKTCRGLGRKTFGTCSIPMAR
jgi:hypothetical protein